MVAAELLYLLQLGDGEVGRRGQEEWDGEEVHGVGDEVVVAELHVFQADRAPEIVALAFSHVSRVSELVIERVRGRGGLYY